MYCTYLLLCFAYRSAWSMRALPFHVKVLSAPARAACQSLSSFPSRPPTRLLLQSKAPPALHHHNEPQQSQTTRTHDSPKPPAVTGPPAQRLKGPAAQTGTLT